MAVPSLQLQIHPCSGIVDQRKDPETETGRRIKQK